MHDSGRLVLDKPRLVYHAHSIVCVMCAFSEFGNLFEQTLQKIVIVEPDLKMNYTNQTALLNNFGSDVDLGLACTPFAKKFRPPKICVIW